VVRKENAFLNLANTMRPEAKTLQGRTAWMFIKSVSKTIFVVI